MSIQFDPGDAGRFWQQIRGLPGYPANTDMPIHTMLFEQGALFRLPELLERAGGSQTHPLLVVMDATPMRRGPDQLKPLILEHLRASGWQPEQVCLEPEHGDQVHTDFTQIKRVQALLQPNTAVVSIGSGTITDIAKHACYLFEQEHGPKLPFVVYQTANSVSAYTSNMAPVFVDGVKRTLASRYPDVLVCDLETLCDAPYAMTAAGVGDLLAACSSFADWYLAHRFGLDSSYSTLPQTLTGPLGQTLLTHAEAIRTRTPAGMALLAKLISLAGLAMSLAHTTAPLSGYEHVISHVLDLMAERAGRPLAIHGQQVALATILATATYQHFLAQFDPIAALQKPFTLSSETMEAHIREAFAPLDQSGGVAAECWSDYRVKLAAWNDAAPAIEAFCLNWDAERADLEAMACLPERVVQILKAVDAPLQFDALEPPIQAEDAQFAYLNAPLIRKRLTLGDLPICFGWNRTGLWEACWAKYIQITREQRTMGKEQIFRG